MLAGMHFQYTLYLAILLLSQQSIIEEKERWGAKFFTVSSIFKFLTLIVKFQGKKNLSVRYLDNTLRTNVTKIYDISLWSR